MRKDPGENEDGKKGSKVDKVKRRKNSKAEQQEK
jgi:hypothetical protein